MDASRTAVNAESEAGAAQLFGKQLLRKLLLPTVIAVLAYAALLFYGDFASVTHAIQQISGRALLVGCGLSVASFALRALRWVYYLRISKVQTPFTDSVLIFLIGLGMTITPGKAGELLKSLMLKDRYDVPVARSAPVVFAERLMDLAALLALGIGGFLWDRSLALALLLGALVLVGCFAFGRSRRLGMLVIRLLCSIPKLAPYREKLATSHSALCDLYGPLPFAVATLLSLSAWGLQALIVIVLADAITPDLVTLPHALVAYAAPLIGGSLSLLPGGLGFAEASMTGALMALSSMPATEAATLTILTRGVTFWLAILVGFATLGLWRPHRRE